MSLRTLLTRSGHLTRKSPRIARAFSVSACGPSANDNVNHRANDTADAHREAQTSKPLNPHMTNTNSTIANAFPSIGTDKPPPEFLSSVDGDFAPIDSVPENTERMTGGTQKQDAGTAGGDMQSGGAHSQQGPAAGSSGRGGKSGGAGGADANARPNAELGVGEIEGGSFRVEPLRRTGEDANTMRARLLCPLLCHNPYASSSRTLVQSTCYLHDPFKVFIPLCPH